ncbi:unnamed protein product, partial [Mycena citricolor]
MTPVATFVLHDAGAARFAWGTFIWIGDGASLGWGSTNAVEGWMTSTTPTISLGSDTDIVRVIFSVSWGCEKSSKLALKRSLACETGSVAVTQSPLGEIAVVFSPFAVAKALNAATVAADGSMKDLTWSIQSAIQIFKGLTLVANLFHRQPLAEVLVPWCRELHKLGLEASSVVGSQTETQLQLVSSGGRSMADESGRDGGPALVQHRQSLGSRRRNRNKDGQRLGESHRESARVQRGPGRAAGMHHGDMRVRERPQRLPKLYVGKRILTHAFLISASPTAWTRLTG